MKDAFEVAALAALGKLNKQQMKQQQVCYSDYLQAFATFSDDFKASGTVTFINYLGIIRSQTDKCLHSLLHLKATLISPGSSTVSRLLRYDIRPILVGVLPTGCLAYPPLAITL